MTGKKQRTVYKKKRKGFVGKQFQELAKGDRSASGRVNQDTGNSDEAMNSKQPDSGIEPSSVNNLLPMEDVSNRKLLNSSLNSEHLKKTQTRKQNAEDGISVPSVEKAHGYKMQDASCLQVALNNAAMCKSCKSANSKLVLFQENTKKRGMCESLFLKCSNCDTKTSFETSKIIDGKGGASEVNRRSVVATLHMGGGLAKLQKFCAAMNLPSPVTKKPYNKHLKKIEKAAEDHAQKIIVEAGDRLKTKLRRKKAEGHDSDEPVPCTVSVDGTWQKRGHSSKIGVVFVISTETNEVLDFEVKSMVCHECRSHDSWDKSSDKYKSWMENHKEHCSINHINSSDAMEHEAAIQIFSRSIEKHNLKYTVFVGDGDSKSFAAVRDAMMEKYGDKYIVVKVDCVGHVQKRMGTNLRTYKNKMKGQVLSDKKGVGGKGRLTDVVIDRMQNYYGQAIRGNVGDVKAMTKAVWAIFDHMIEGDGKSTAQHKNCPPGKDSWCRFQKDKALGTSTYDATKRLPHAFRKELLPIFTRLSNNELLERCKQGLTQNQNEAINGVLWSHCPKTIFCGKRRVNVAVCETVSTFNTGAGTIADILTGSNVAIVGQNTLKALRREDQSRIKISAVKVSMKYRERRRKLRGLRMKKKDKSISYLSGAFGTSAVPEVGNDLTRKARKRKKIDEQRTGLSKQPKSNPEIVFAVPEVEFIAAHPDAK